MAAWLGPRLPATTRILVSPAVRTQQTAAALGHPFETDAALAPGASVDDVLRAACWPDASRTTLIVGHEPTLGDVAAWLLDGQSGGRPLKKGAVVWLAQHRAGDAKAVRDAYGAERYARLVEVKDRWDPENVFRLNHNIEPSGR